jgi:hypothetical protein
MNSTRYFGKDPDAESSDVSKVMGFFDTLHVLLFYEKLSKFGAGKKINFKTNIQPLACFWNALYSVCP